MNPLLIPAAISLGNNLLNRVTPSPKPATHETAFVEAMKRAESTQGASPTAIPQADLDRITALPEVQRVLKKDGIDPQSLRFSANGKLFFMCSEGHAVEIPLTSAATDRVRAIFQTPHSLQAPARSGMILG